MKIFKLTFAFASFNPAKKIKSPGISLPFATLESKYKIAIFADTYTLS